VILGVEDERDGVTDRGIVGIGIRDELAVVTAVSVTARPSVFFWQPRTLASCSTFHYLHSTVVLSCDA
jgi:hypothetical protein